jgi:hypothetical protein
VFSDLFGLVTLAYPAWGGWIVLAAGAGLAGLAGAVLARKRLVSPGPVALGAAGALGGTIGLGLVLEAANWLWGAGAGADYYDRLAAIPRLEAQAACLVLAGVALLSARRPSPAVAWGGWLGAIGLLLILALAVQLAAPGAGPLIAWPALAAAALAAFASLADPELEKPWALAVLAAAGAAAVAFVLCLGHLAFLGVGLDMPAAMAIAALLASTLIRPLIDSALAPRPALVLAAVLAVAGLTLALWVRLDGPAPSLPLYDRPVVGGRAPA